MLAVIHDPVAVLAVLLAVLAALFGFAQHPAGQKLFRVVPLLVFAYFVPTALSNLDVIPLSSPLYKFIKTWLLPSSLVLLTLSIDIPAIVRLGKPALIMFFTATATIVIGGPLALLVCAPIVPDSMGEEVWKGLAALSGSWIGGGANFIAIKESVGASDAIIGLMVVVDVAVASVWMAVLLWFAGREQAMDDKLGADRRALDEVRREVASYQASVAKPTSLGHLLGILAIALGATVLATYAARELPELGDIIGQFTWVVMIATAIGVALSFTPARKLEGAGAGAVGSVFLYLLVASIGASAEFHRVVDAPALVVIGAVWMVVHGVVLLVVRRAFKIPIFFAAVGSQANVGGAASAPIVAAAFHPALAPVGVLLAVGGYVLGTYAALVCAALLERVYGLL